MSFKCIAIGAIVFFIVSNIIGMGVTGPLIHEGVLDSAYRANESFWLPELRQDPPDMAALLPMWMLSSVILSVIVAFLYCVFRRCVTGPGWQRGLKVCLCLALFGCGMMLGWSGILALPATLWIWWSVDFVIIYAIAGVAMGWATGKWAAD